MKPKVTKLEDKYTWFLPDGEALNYHRNEIINSFLAIRVKLFEVHRWTDDGWSRDVLFIDEPLPKGINWWRNCTGWGSNGEVDSGDCRDMAELLLISNFLSIWNRMMHEPHSPYDNRSLEEWQLAREQKMADFINEGRDLLEWRRHQVEIWNTNHESQISLDDYPEKVRGVDYFLIWDIVDDIDVFLKENEWFKSSYDHDRLIWQKHGRAIDNDDWMGNAAIHNRRGSPTVRRRAAGVWKRFNGIDKNY